MFPNFVKSNSFWPGQFITWAEFDGGTNDKGFIFLHPLPWTMSSRHSLTLDNILDKSISFLYTLLFFKKNPVQLNTLI